MKTTIYLPNKIKVGFQKRSDTYTKMLGYVIYFDEKGTLRKEKSWEHWRDKSIEALEFDNTSTEGFILNRNGGGGYSDRNEFCRVYDPRGFEFEISFANLLYILQNTSCVKGKGLEGKFVYGFDSGKLILLPEEAPEYKEIVGFSDIINSKTTIKRKDMVIGYTYLNKKKERLLYLGYYDYWFKYYSNKNFHEDTYITKSKKLFFINLDCKWSSIKFEELSSTSSLLYLHSDTIDEKFNYYMEELEHYSNYSPIGNENHYEPIEIKPEEINWKYYLKDYRKKLCLLSTKEAVELYSQTFNNVTEYYYKYYLTSYNNPGVIISEEDLKTLFCIQTKYLKNGKIHKY